MLPAPQGGADVDEMTAFLNARLNEDEATALKSKDAPEEAVRFVDADEWSQPLIWLADEDRMLREVEAKRALLRAEQALADANPALAESLHCIPRCLAAAYCNHPDYREEWKP
jgi:hypothetical protein